MDFHLTREQELVRQMMHDFTENEVKPIAAETDKTSTYPRENIEKLFDLGVMGMVVPEEFGGAGADDLSSAIAIEELSKQCASTGDILATHNGLCCGPIIANGTPAQKEKYLRMLTEGHKVGAFALTEPGAGSDAGGVSTRAVRNKEEGTYTLNGTKMFITNGGLAEIFLVFANTRKTGGIRGLTAFIVPKDTPGFSVGKKENKMGIRPSNTTELVLQDVVIPESYRVGREGEGFRIAMNTLDSARPFVGAVSVGIAQAALDCAVKYAKERRQFGQPIASFQMVQGMLADMAMKVETARLMVQKACWMRDQGMEFSKEAAMAKCYAADVAMQVTTDAVQVMGGYGYTKEYPVEKMMRDAKIMQIYEGTNQIQRLVIANKLLY